MQIVVRDFVEADREALRALFVAARDAAFSWAAAGAHRLEDFDASTAGERILVAELASHPIGFASVWQEDSFLHNLFGKFKFSFQEKSSLLFFLLLIELHDSRNNR